MFLPEMFVEFPLCVHELTQQSAGDAEPRWANTEADGGHCDRGTKGISLG